MQPDADQPLIYLGLGGTTIGVLGVSDGPPEVSLDPDCYLFMGIGAASGPAVDAERAAYLVRENANISIGSFELSESGLLTLGMGMPGSACSERSLIETLAILLIKAAQYRG